MNPPYAIFPIGLLALAFYLLSYLLSRFGIIRTSLHRQSWNILLLLTFLVTASLGLILAVKVNYKLKFSFSEQLLTWHVDFGIGMAMVAIFHLLWHLDYYLKLFRKSGKPFLAKKDEEIPGAQLSENFKPASIRQLPVFALGMTAIAAQLILLREFLTIFRGNELVIGTILANWMILTASGAYLGRSTGKIIWKKLFVFYALLLSAIIPMLTVFFLNYLKNIIFPLGTMVSFYQVSYFSFLLLLPFCLLSGFLFTSYSVLISGNEGSNQVSKVYSMEALGSLAAGIFYSFFLIWFFHSLESLAIIFFINVVIATVFQRELNSRLFRPVILIIAAAFVGSVFIFHPDIRLKSYLYPNQQVLYMNDSPFGNLVVTESAGQKNFFENNVLLFSTDNVMGSEETAHFAMLQSSSPKNVLLIGGGISGTIPEILKYPVERIDYCELNPWLVRIGQKYTDELNDPRIRLIIKDPRQYIRSTDEKYDVVIIDMPPPESAQVNRLYTIEFFRELKKTCNDKAIVSLSLPSTENYVSENAARVQSVILQTLKKVFRNVTVIPGEKNYFTAGDGVSSLDITKLVAEKGISNLYVNQYYLDDSNLRSRSQLILQNLPSTAEINTDFRPRAYFMETGYWLSHFGKDYGIAGIVALVILSFLFVRLKAVNLGIFTTGFTSSSMEILFIFSFQVIYGYVYQVTGIIITIFMAGLAIGAISRDKLFVNAGIGSFRKIQFAFAVLSVVLPGLILGINYLHLPAILVQVFFFLSTLAVSVLTGAQFSIASGISPGTINKVSGSLYSLDLLGSAIGAFLVAVWLFPMLGLVKVFFLLGILNVIAGLATFRIKKTRL